jgi:hypothetical protein
MENGIKKIMAAATFFAVMAAMTVYADTQDTTVTFVIPSSIVHSLTYSDSCSASNFFFVENDTSKDGYAIGINVSSDATPDSFCFGDEGNATLTINNDGSSMINVSANFTTALPSGVEVFVAQNYSGFWNGTGDTPICGGPITNTTACDTLTAGANKGVLVGHNIAAQTGAATAMFQANFTNFNSGVETGTTITRTMRTTAFVGLE